MDHLKRNDRSWQVKNEAINRTATDQIEERLKTLRDQEQELDDIIVTDSEAFVDMKHKMEENIASLTDQIQLLDAVSFFVFFVLHNTSIKYSDGNPADGNTCVVAAQYVLIENN